jgi:hypothetical protein
MIFILSAFSLDYPNKLGKNLRDSAIIFGKIFKVNILSFWKEKKNTIRNFDGHW